MNITLSRRRLVLGGAALATAGLLPMDATQLAGQTTTLAASDRELSVVTGSDPGFAKAVEQLYPGLSKQPGFQELMPLSILVTLEKGPSVRALSVSWSVTADQSMYETAMFSYISPGSFAKGHSISSLGSARLPILRRGQTRLVTPFFNWTPDNFKNNAAAGRNSSLAAAQPGGFLFSELSKSGAAVVALDAAVFSDWKLIGPDRFNLTRRLRSRRNAEHDEALIYHRLIKLGASDAEIQQKLEQRASTGRSSSAYPPARWYNQARTFQAKMLLRTFQEAPKASFVRAVNRLTRRKDTFIVRAV